MVQPGDRDGQVEAVQALYDAEHGVAQSNAQVSVAVVGLLIAYLPVSAAMVAKSEVPAFLVPWLALPVLFMLAYHMVLTAQALRRTASARIIERRLVALADLEDEYETGRIGWPSSDPVSDAGWIATHRDAAWISRWFAVVAPLVGMVVLCLAYNGYMLWEASRQLPDYPGRWGFVVGIVVSAIMWTALIDAMVVDFTGRPRPVAIIAVASVGVALQFLQDEDPTFPLTYITVIGAVGCIVGAFATMVAPGSVWLRRLYRSAALTVFWASIVFWVAVVPFWGRVGYGEPMIAAGFVLCLGLPLLLLAELFVKRGTSYGTERLHWSVLAVPVAYLVPVTIGTLALDWPPPYPFLDWRGAPLVAAGIVVVSGLAILGLDIAVRRLDRAI